MTIDRGDDGGPDLQLQLVHQQIEVDVAHGHAEKVANRDFERPFC